jgi:aminoglycoside phosphotransferase (APT) family kinase protein
LIKYIFKKEKLPFDKIEKLTPGTNAVFKVGNYVIKIFAPNESGIDQTLDLQTELFAMKRSGALGVSVPKLIAEGIVNDKYCFAYIVTEYINGIEFTNAVETMTDIEKINFGKKLRELTDIMNTSCERFNNIDVIHDKGRYKRWNKYSGKFKKERIAYIRSNNFGENIFVHGDLCRDNIIITSKGELAIIDFADAVLAPKIYEQVLIVMELFKLNTKLLHGYFGYYSIDELIYLCFNGLLIHDFGGDILKNYINNIYEVNSLGEFKNKLIKIIGNRIK